MMIEPHVAVDFYAVATQEVTVCVIKPISPNVPVCPFFFLKRIFVFPIHQVGKASWYGRPFQHKRTASGETFDMYQFTAAHRTLPLGSWVKVTDLKNDRSVVVRINDRGPVPKNRIIDLSYGAAKMLGMSQNGIHPVRVELVETPTISQNGDESNPVLMQDGRP